MTARYYVTPYDPAGWRDPDADEDTRPKSDLKVVAFDLKRRLRREWPHVNTFPPFSWTILYPDEPGVTGSLIGDDHQILALEFGKGFKELVLWYRSYIPSAYRLFLFPEEGEWKSLELTAKTTIEDITRFMGF